jgi:hypothetical protein
MLDEMNRMK